MENKLKHLEFIQSAINRMSTNSFIVKGWTITLVALIFTTSLSKINGYQIFILFIPVLMFWILDGFFLSKEKAFRSLFDHTRKLKVEEIDFSMDISNFKKGGNSWFYVLLSHTLIIFYILLIISILIINYLIK